MDFTIATYLRVITMVKSNLVGVHCRARPYNMGFDDNNASESIR